MQLQQQEVYSILSIHEGQEQAQHTQHKRKRHCSVPHVQQLFSWDCGLACVLMVLRALGCSCCDYQKLRSLCETTSVWTVDLAYLLACNGAAVTFTTLTLGINHSYANEAFYMDHLSEDERRVQNLFDTAHDRGITVQQRSVSAEELAAAVSGGQQLALLLVDKRRLDPWQHVADLACNMTTKFTSLTGYMGHYILLVDYDPPQQAAPGSSMQHQHQQQQQLDPQHAEASCHQHSNPRGQGACTTALYTSPLPVSNHCDEASAAAAGGTAATVGSEQSSSSSSMSGVFWVHDPAQPDGPRPLSAAVIEAARRSFGTDEDVLFIDMTRVKSGASAGGHKALADQHPHPWAAAADSTVSLEQQMLLQCGSEGLADGATQLACSQPLQLCKLHGQAQQAAGAPMQDAVSSSPGKRQQQGAAGAGPGQSKQAAPQQQSGNQQQLQQQLLLSPLQLLNDHFLTPASLQQPYQHQHQQCMSSVPSS